MYENVFKIINLQSYEGDKMNDIVRNDKSLFTETSKHFHLGFVTNMIAAVSITPSRQRTTRQC